MYLSKSPLVGKPWTPKIPPIPGQHGSNHYAKNNNPFLPDPMQTNPNQTYKAQGGKKRNNKTMKNKHLIRRKLYTKSKSKNMTKTKSRAKAKSRAKTKSKPKAKSKAKAKSKSKVKNKNKVKIGGWGKTLLPQPLVDLGRDIEYRFKSGYNTVLGYPQPVNPSYLSQPIMKK